MRTFIRTLKILLAIAIVVFLIASPSYILINAGRDPYREWQARPEEFSGVLYVWHIVGFKAYSGSLGAWAEACAKTVESKHFDVFFQIDAMTIEEFETRIAQGDSPDIYSFPAGLLYADVLAALDEYSVVGSENIIPELANTGRHEGRLYALPLLYSAYTLLLNSEAAAQTGLDSNALRSGQLNIAEAAESLAGDADEPHVAGNALIYAMLEGTGECAEYSKFRSQDVNMAVADLREAGDSARSFESGRGFMTEAMPALRYTDLVQLVGINREITPEKMPYALEYISALLDADSQSDLESSGVFPAVGISEDSSLDGISSECYEAGLNEPIAPNAFLLTRYADALTEESERALAGDAAARKSLFDRLFELTGTREFGLLRVENNSGI